MKLERNKRQKDGDMGEEKRKSLRSRMKKKYITKKGKTKRKRSKRKRRGGGGRNIKIALCSRSSNRKITTRNHT